MNIIIVDDEQFAMMDLQAVVGEAVPGGVINSFSTPAAALEYAAKNRVDVAFLDIEMGSMNGLQLAKRLKDIYGKTNIVFVTGYSHYAVDAFAVHASGYLSKPATVKAVKDSLENLRYPVEAVSETRLYVRAFGNFDVFADGKPLHFPRSKSKELFAYLVHKKGTGCTMRELAAALEEGSEKNIQMYISVMVKVLENAGFADVFNKSRNNISVNTSGFRCDYYSFLEGDPEAVNAYMGEYMAQYSWAEFTTAYLDKKISAG